MSETADFTIEVRDRDFLRVGQIAPEYTDIKFVDVHNGVGVWELKLPSEHPLLPSLTAKGSGIVVTEHWMEGAVHKYRVYSGRMRSARLSQDAADPAGTWVVSGVDDNVLGAATRVYPDPASPATAQTTGYWEQTGTAETVMKLAVQLNAGSTALVSRRYPWLTIAANALRGGTVSCSSRFDVLGDLLTSLGTAAGLGWEFRQVGAGVTFDVYEPADKRGEVRLDIRNGGLESNELGFTAPSATEVLVLGQGEGAARTVVPVTSPEAAAEAAAWGIRWESTKDQRQTDDPAELTQAGAEVIAEQGTTVNSLKVVPSDAPGMRLGRDWYRGDRVTVVVDGQETSAVVTQVATSISAAGVIRQVTVGDPVGFSFDAKIASKVASVEKRIGQVERLVGQGVAWGDIAGVNQRVADWNSAKEPGFYDALPGALNAPFAAEEFSGVVTLAPGGLVRQEVSTPLAGANSRLTWSRVFTPGSPGSWSAWARSDGLMVPTSVVGGTVDPLTGRVNLTVGSKAWSLNGVFVPEYRKYRVDYQYFTGDENGAWIRLRANGADEAYNGYVYSGIHHDSTGVAAAGGSTDRIGHPFRGAYGHAGYMNISEPMYVAGNQNQKRFEWHDFHSASPSSGGTIGGGWLGGRDTVGYDGFTISLSNQSMNGVQPGAHAWISVTALA
ncbi:minor tail protein [Microbacterium phage ChiliPepper]|nr:minor tail protein [Microbacterium phage ChiliPepper]